MKITNTRILHSVENESAHLNLRGEVQFSGERIASFSGQFYKPAVSEEVNTYAGDFYFNENEEGATVNKSLSSIPADLHTHACDLLEATVVALHEYSIAQPAENA